MAQRMRAVAILVASLIVSVLSQTGQFINPPPGPCNEDTIGDATVYNVGDIISLQWEVSLSEVTVALWQGIEGTSGTNYQLPGASVYYDKTLTWTVDPLGYDLSSNPTFHLAIFAVNATSWIFDSACFNITNNGNVQATLHLATPLPSSTSSSSASSASKTDGSKTSITKGPATTSGAPAATVTKAGSNNSVAIGAGVGVGVGVGVLLIGAAALFFIFRRRKQNDRPASNQQYPQSPNYGYGYDKPGMGGPGPSNRGPGQPNRAELAPWHGRSEAEGSPAKPLEMPARHGI